MSVPRLTRTVALTAGRRAAAERPHPPGRGAPHRRSPGVGLSGMRLTWAPRGTAMAASSTASERRSLTPSMTAHSKLSRRPLAARYVLAGFHQSRQRVAPVDGHQLVAQLVVGRVEGHGQVDRQLLAGQAADAGDDPDGGHGEVTGRQSRCRSCSRRDGGPHAGRSWPGARPCP